MTDYYHTAATIPEPKYTAPEGNRSTNPISQQRAPASEDTPTHPKSTAAVQRPVHHVQTHQQQRPMDTRSSTKIATVNPILRQRCGKCETLLRRLLPLILLFFYTLLGGMLFHYVEKEYEMEMLRQGAPGRALIDEPAAVQLNKRFTEIVLDTNYTRQKRTLEVRRALLWYLDLLDERLREISGEEIGKWDFVSAVFYSLSVYTTIGYGRPAPATSAGKILTILYALIGIPMALITLIQLSYALICLIAKLWTTVRHGKKSQGRKINWQTIPGTDLENRLQEERDDLDLLAFPLSAIIFVIFIWSLLTALFFYVWENPRWSYGDGLYFTFMSFSTIGISGRPWSGWGKLAGAILLIIGLVLITTVLIMIFYQMEALYRSLERGIEAEYRESLSDSGESMATNWLEIDDALNRMAARLPLGSRCLYWMMPKARKKSLRRYYRSKASLLNRSIQTDDYLWAMSPSNIHPLKTIGEEKAEPFEDTRSRDDVNSLVAMCDYSLQHPYKGAAKMEY